MIRRVVLLKLKESVDPQGVVALARRVLPSLPMVVSAEIGTPLDEEAEVWDVLMSVCVSGHGDLTSYLVHPDHRRFLEKVLPQVEVRKAWNFRIE